MNRSPTRGSVRQRSGSSTHCSRADRRSDHTLNYFRKRLAGVASAIENRRIDRDWPQWVQSGRSSAQWAMAAFRPSAAYRGGYQALDLPCLEARSPTPPCPPSRSPPLRKCEPVTGRRRHIRHDRHTIQLEAVAPLNFLQAAGESSKSHHRRHTPPEAIPHLLVGSWRLQLFSVTYFTPEPRVVCEQWVAQNDAHCPIPDCGRW